MQQTLIIDDEAHIRDTLSKMLLKFCPQVKLASVATGVASGIQAISNLHPDLVFLDINLGDGNAFDLLHAIRNFDFRVIFISSFNNEAIRTMKKSGIDYLQKPFNPSDLVEIVKKSELSGDADKTTQIEVLENSLGLGKRRVEGKGK